MGKFLLFLLYSNCEIHCTAFEPTFLFIEHFNNMSSKSDLRMSNGQVCCLLSKLIETIDYRMFLEIKWQEKIKITK